MTHNQAYRLSISTYGLPGHQTTALPQHHLLHHPHPPHPTTRYQHLCDVALPPATSNLLPPSPTPPTPPPPPPTTSVDDNRLEGLDPTGCPPLVRKSHPPYRIDLKNTNPRRHREWNPSLLISRRTSYHWASEAVGVESKCGCGPAAVAASRRIKTRQVMSK